MARRRQRSASSPEIVSYARRHAAGGRQRTSGLRLLASASPSPTSSMLTCRYPARRQTDALPLCLVFDPFPTARHLQAGRLQSSAARRRSTSPRTSELRTAPRQYRLVADDFRENSVIASIRPCAPGCFHSVSLTSQTYDSPRRIYWRARTSPLTWSAGRRSAAEPGGSQLLTRCRIDADLTITLSLIAYLTGTPQGARHRWA